MTNSDWSLRRFILPAMNSQERALRGVNPINDRFLPVIKMSNTSLSMTSEVINISNTPLGDRKKLVCERRALSSMAHSCRLPEGVSGLILHSFCLYDQTFGPWACVGWLFEVLFCDNRNGFMGLCLVFWVTCFRFQNCNTEICILNQIQKSVF
jgi:hypothetical protein